MKSELNQGWIADLLGCLKSNVNQENLKKQYNSYIHSLGNTTIFTNHIINPYNIVYHYIIYSIGVYFI